MKKLGVINLIVIALCSFGLGINVMAEPPIPMVVSYLKLHDYDAHYQYRYQLVEQALEITRAEFGSYQLEPYQSQASSSRYAQLLSEGEQLNLLWASPGTPTAKGDGILIPVDIVKGLLGYRVCLINKDVYPNLSFITDLASFASIKVGQGPWPDRAVYQFNHIAEVDSPNFSNLFKMLAAKRFDCIPLGVDEIERVYQNKKAQYPFLAIDSHLLIYYHYPVYFYVSKNHPELAERLTLGLKKMQRNGDFDRFFLEFHAQDLARLALQKRKLICLKSPYQDVANQCTRPPAFPDAL